MKSACPICGGAQFSERRILWPALIAEWELAAAEIDYIDLQQGRWCNKCGASLRIQALAAAVGAIPPLTRILELNGVGAFSTVLSRLPGYVRADYPAVDMRALPYADGAFDLVLHSDTLEHVDGVAAALRECRRVLAAGGRLCFTAPVIVGRMSRSRAGLPKSYHGFAGQENDDLVVHTEFGADTWCAVMEAGFTSVTINAIDYPAGLAICARGSRG